MKIIGICIRHLRTETDFIVVPTNNFYLRNSRKETDLIDGPTPIHSRFFVSELNKINNNKEKSNEEIDYKIHFPPLTAFSTLYSSVHSAIAPLSFF